MSYKTRVLWLIGISACCILVLNIHNVGKSRRKLTKLLKVMASDTAAHNTNNSNNHRLSQRNRRTLKSKHYADKPERPDVSQVLKQTNGFWKTINTLNITLFILDKALLKDVVKRGPKSLQEMTDDRPTPNKKLKTSFYVDIGIMDVPLIGADDWESFVSYAVNKKNGLRVKLVDENHILIRPKKESNLQLRFARIESLNNYFVIPGPTRNISGVLKLNETETLAVDDFHFMEGKKLSVFFIPNDIPAYIRHLEMGARFVKCNYAEAARYRLVMDVEGAEQELRNQFSAVAYDMRKTYLHFGMRIWLNGGSLLGWWRQCDIIPGSADGDFLTDIRDYNPAVVEEYRKPDRDVWLVWHFGKRDDILQHAMMGFGFKNDVFFLYTEKNYSYCGQHIYHKGYKYHHIYPIVNAELCSTDLLGFLHYVPCDDEQTQAILEADYGVNYTLPAAKEWWRERANMEYAGMYNKTEMARVIKRYTVRSIKKGRELKNYHNGLFNKKYLRLEIDW